MAEDNKSQTGKKNSPDWFVRGILTKLGETFDRLTGRNWQPSSSLATSELGEKLKNLLDAEVKDLGAKGQFVPHNIKLKMQWDKFSTDAEAAMQKLENELLIVAVDHINDRRYHTYAPLKLEIKPDYFTEGVKLLVSFDKFADETEREAAVNVTVPDLKNVMLASSEVMEVKPEKEIFIVEFQINGKPKKVELAFSEKQRLSVGRTKENDLIIDDQSISKIHAALVLSSDNQLLVADTGSTNGTFVNGQRIAYGKGVSIKNGDKVNFGTVAVAIEHITRQIETVDVEEFHTQQEFVTEEVDIADQTSAPTVAFQSEEIPAQVDNTTKPDYSTKGDIFRTREGFSEKAIEPQLENEIADNTDSQVDALSTKEGIILDFGDKG